MNKERIKELAHKISNIREDDHIEAKSLFDVAMYFLLQFNNFIYL